MSATLGHVRRCTVLTIGLFFPLSSNLIGFAWAGLKPDSFWQVDDVRAGMKGEGRTVMKGTKIEAFEAEVLGVLKNTSPGRDMILCRLSGLNLDKTGVIAGMSGSPIYIDGKLLGAVAYAWPFGKEPIAGVTPFIQMHEYVESYERRDLVEKNQPTRIGLREPLTIGGKAFESVTVAQGLDDPEPTPADGLWMVPLRTPLVATGFTPHSLALLRSKFPSQGWLPMQGGAVGGKIAQSEKDTPLQPGGPMAVSLITGDFDLSGMGTVTHIEGDRVYGFGHPFFNAGTCEFPLLTGYIHTIYPRQSVSFKMGSPLKPVGVINADVSTCIAGWLNRKVDMLPVRITVIRERNDSPKVFNVEIARQRSMQAGLVYSALTNSVDMEGDLPEELTAELKAQIEIEGKPTVVIKDIFSGSSYSGGRTPQALYNQIGLIVNLLAYNSYQPIRIKRIECETQIFPGRRTADIEAVELASETLSPGDTLKATVFVRPFKGLRQRLPVTLQLPADLPEGNYTATICDDLASARAQLRENPILTNPQSLEHVFQALKVQTAIKRTQIVMRVPIPAVGVAVNGKTLPNLPPSMVQILGTGRKTGSQTLGTSLVSQLNTDWVIQGSESVRFTVTKNKKLTSQE
jgi:hypothetical protein